MRAQTEHSAYIRAQMRSVSGFLVPDPVENGGSGKLLPNALAALAAAESVNMFLLVKLSGCREGLAKTIFLRRC